MPEWEGWEVRRLGGCGDGDDAGMFTGGCYVEGFGARGVLFASWGNDEKNVR